jgi:hypothetical protein
MTMVPLSTTDARQLGRTIGEHLRDRPANERLEFFLGMISELEWLAQGRDVGTNRREEAWPTRQNEKRQMSRFRFD